VILIGGEALLLKEAPMRLSRFFALVGVALCLAASACQTTLDEGRPVVIPTEETAQDQLLSKAVRDRLLADKKVDLSEIRVVSNSGTVYLVGLVNSLDARQQAIKIAWEVQGVKTVVNSLEVKK
jgi:osmotically-inducible protein OsmY